MTIYGDKPAIVLGRIIVIAGMLLLGWMLPTRSAHASLLASDAGLTKIAKAGFLKSHWPAGTGNGRTGIRPAVALAAYLVLADSEEGSDQEMPEEGMEEQESFPEEEPTWEQNQEEGMEEEPSEDLQEESPEEDQGEEQQNFEDENVPEAEPDGEDTPESDLGPEDDSQADEPGEADPDAAQEETAPE